jgi:hypothetical protein
MSRPGRFSQDGVTNEWYSPSLTEESANERSWHVAFDDSLCETFGDGRLSNTRLPNKYRIVLCSPTQDADGASDFIVLCA